MLRRRIARLCLLLTLPALACQPPPAAEPTETPGDPQTAAPAETAEPGGEPEPEPAADLPAADEVLAASIDALGGAEAIAAIKSSYTEATTEIKAQGITVVTKIWAKDGNFYTESDMPGMGLTQVWKKGDEIWSKDPINGMRKLEGAEAEQARWGADPLLAANWNEYFDEAKTVARSQDGDRDLVEVELRKGEQWIRLLFDEKTHLPAGQAFEQESPMGTMPIRVLVDDYREIEGVMTPFRSVTDMSLMKLEQLTKKYEVNVEIDDAKFEPPAAGGKSGKGKGKGKK